MYEFSTLFVVTATKPPPLAVASSFIIALFSTLNPTFAVEFMFEFSIFVTVDVLKVVLAPSVLTETKPPEPFDDVTLKVFVEL